MPPPDPMDGESIVAFFSRSSRGQHAQTREGSLAVLTRAAPVPRYSLSPSRTFTGDAGWRHTTPTPDPDPRGPSASDAGSVACGEAAP